MLRLLIGVALGAVIATAVHRIFTEQEKQRLVDEIARLYQFEDQANDGL